MEKERCYEAERVPTKEEFYEGYAKNMSIAMKYELKCAQIRKAYEEVYGEEMDPRAYINLIDHRRNYEEEDRD